MAEAILKMGSLEIHTRDPLCVSTLWQLLGSSVSDDERAQVQGWTTDGEPAERSH